LGATLAKTVGHFFPQLRSWLTDLTETRFEPLIVYHRRFMVWVGLAVFLLKLGARRKIGFELASPMSLANLNHLSGCRQQSIPHPDTLDHFVGHAILGEVAAIRRKMIHRLIRMKALDDARLRGHLIVVLDGTGQLVYHERHCEHCLEQTVHGKTIYSHPVLEAKLVTPSGLAISVGTEFIENVNPKASKQDCELAAFGRLARRLKKDFPQLQLCLCLDALYACGQVLEVCRENHWKYFIVFKEGSLPAVWQEFQMLLKLCPHNRKVHRPARGCRQTFAWAEDLQYVDDRGRPQQFNAFQCHEVRPGKKQFFAWMTNFRLGAENVIASANRGARCRWKIENQGFNIQKNGGFNLEHAYSNTIEKAKVYYLLMQIAHLMLQLIEKGSLLPEDCITLFGGLGTMARRLSESLRHYLIDPQTLAATAAGIRIRLDTS